LGHKSKETGHLVLRLLTVIVPRGLTFSLVATSVVNFDP
jgi:hypothetical protein